MRIDRFEDVEGWKLGRKLTQGILQSPEMKISPKILGLTARSPGRVDPSCIWRKVLMPAAQKNFCDFWDIQKDLVPRSRANCMSLLTSITFPRTSSMNYMNWQEKLEMLFLV